MSETIKLVCDDKEIMIGPDRQTTFKTKEKTFKGTFIGHINHRVLFMVDDKPMWIIV